MDANIMKCITHTLRHLHLTYCFLHANPSFLLKLLKTKMSSLPTVYWILYYVIHTFPICWNQMFKRTNPQMDFLPLFVLLENKVGCTLNCLLCYKLFFKSNYNSIFNQFWYVKLTFTLYQKVSTVTEIEL